MKKEQKIVKKRADKKREQKKKIRHFVRRQGDQIWVVSLTTVLFTTSFSFFVVIHSPVVF